MKLIACYKLTPEDETIEVNDDRTLNFAGAEWKIGQYDLNAVEAGLELAAASGSELVALTVGGEIIENSKLKKSILSRGPSEMYGIKSEGLADADSYTVAKALKAGVEKIGDAGLVLCGEGSADMYAQEVGCILGSLLGWSTVNAVSKINAAGDTLIVERSLEGGVEVLEVPLPAVVSVTSDINLPRIPGMKDILSAGKKPSVVWGHEDVGVGIDCVTETVSVLAPERPGRMQIVVEGDSDENIDALYNFLRKAL
jgi:electron transfer flavoprotein beta subunit